MSQKRNNADRQISTALISELFLSMKTKIYPDGIADEDFKKHLFAIIHARRASSKPDNKGGRPSKYDRDELENQSLTLDAWLKDKTDGWLKLPYFVTNCVPALWFPLDLKHALDGGKINLEEARILNLVNRKNLGRKVDREPYHIRRDLLESHLRRNGTQKELRRRVNAKLGKTSKAEAESVTRVVAALDAEVNKLIEFDERDTDHLLWEEIKNLVFMARDIDVTLIEGDELTDLLDDLGKIQFKLIKYKPRIEDLIEQE